MCDGDTFGQRRKSRRSFVSEPCDLPKDEAVELENMDVDRDEEDIKVRVRQGLKKYRFGLRCLKRDQLHEATNCVDKDANDENLNLEYRDLMMQVQNAVKLCKNTTKTIDDLQNYCKVIDFKLTYCKKQEQLLDNLKQEKLIAERISIFNLESHLPTFFDD